MTDRLTQATREIERIEAELRRAEDVTSDDGERWRLRCDLARWKAERDAVLERQGELDIEVPG